MSLIFTTEVIIAARLASEPDAPVPPTFTELGFFREASITSCMVLKPDCGEATMSWVSTSISAMGVKSSGATCICFCTKP